MSGRYKSEKSKVKITINLSPEIVNWLKMQIEEYEFGSKSFAIEKALREMKKRMEKGEED